MNDQGRSTTQPLTCAVCNRADPHIHADISVERDTLVHVFTKSVIDLTGERNKLETERDHYKGRVHGLERLLRVARDQIQHEMHDGIARCPGCELETAIDQELRF